jgi:hypothetical protein
MLRPTPITRDLGTHKWTHSQIKRLTPYLSQTRKTPPTILGKQGLFSLSDTYREKELYLEQSLVIKKATNSIDVMTSMS